MESLDVQTIGSSGALGAALLFLAQTAVARLWPAKPAPQPQPAQPVIIPQPAPQPATPPAAPEIPASVLAVLDGLLLAAVRSRLPGGVIPPALAAAAPVMRHILDQIAPPTPKP